MLRHHSSSFPLLREGISAPASAPILLHILFSDVAAPPHLRICRRFHRNCSPNPSAQPGEGLTGFLSQQVEELLQKEENQGLLAGLEEASNRVDSARRALAEIERQEKEAAIAKDRVLQLQSRQSEIAETERELSEARRKVEEAERSLAASIGDRIQDNFGESEVIDRDLERLESVKAAGISSAVGTLAALPISSLQATNNLQLAANLGIIFFGCALFGITFRYAVRRDLDNVQLKTGICTAFGFVKGLSAVELSLESVNSSGFNGVESFLQLAVDRGVHVSESIFVFLFSAVALDFCFKSGILSPFPIRSVYYKGSESDSRIADEALSDDRGQSTGPLIGSSGVRICRLIDIHMMNKDGCWGASMKLLPCSRGGRADAPTAGASVEELLPWPMRLRGSNFAAAATSGADAPTVRLRSHIATYDDYNNYCGDCNSPQKPILPHPRGSREKA